MHEPTPVGAQHCCAPVAQNLTNHLDGCFLDIESVAARYFPRYSSASRNNHSASMKCQ